MSIDLTIDSSSLSTSLDCGTSSSLRYTHDLSNKLFGVGDYVKIVNKDLNLSCNIGKIHSINYDYDSYISTLIIDIELLDVSYLRVTDFNDLIIATPDEVWEAKYIWQYNCSMKENLKAYSCGGPKDMALYPYNNLYNKYKPLRIIYNDPATIVFWKDGTKTVVKKAKGERFNKYNAFCAALAKKIFENNSQVNKVVASGVDQTAKKGKNKPCKNK